MTEATRSFSGLSPELRGTRLKIERSSPGRDSGSGERKTSEKMEGGRL